MCLNSLWRKFDQRLDMKHKEYIDNLGDYYRIILDDNIHNINFAFLNDKEIYYVIYENKDEFCKTSYKTNVFVACFCTALAILR